MKQITLMTLANIVGQMNRSMGIILASGNVEEQILQPINLLTELMLAVVSGIGIWMIIKAVPDFADGWMNKDGSGLRNAGMQIIGGLIVALIDPLLHWLGIL